MTDTFYNADRRTYRIAAATLSAAAVVGRIIGPAGKLGRVVGMETVLTLGTTVAVCNVTVGVNGAVLPAVMQIPVLAINLGHQMSAAELKLAGAVEIAAVNDVELPADTVIEVASDGGCTAGAGDLLITIVWF